MRSLLLIPLLLITGCKKGPEHGGKTVVRYLANPDVGGFSKEIIAKFHEANPDVHVEMVEGPAATNTREDMYATSFMAQEDTYDLIYMDVAWMPKFAAKGWLRPLDDWFTPAMQKEFLPGDIAGSKFQGKTYRVPLQSDGGMLYYRTDLVPKAPRTWAELVAAAKQAQKAPELWGFVFQGKQYEGLVCVFLELLWGNGADLETLDSPRAVEALQWLVNAVHTDKISPEGVLTFQEEEARHMFQEGKAVFMRNWPYAYNMMQDDKSPVKGKFAVVPMVHGAGKSAATLGGWGYGISAFSKNPEAAWKFIEFAAREENQRIAFLKGGIIPTRKSLFQDPDILKTSPHMRDWGKILELARPRPIHPQYARISDILQLQVSRALSRQAEPKDALSAAAAEIRKLLKQ